MLLILLFNILNINPLNAQCSSGVLQTAIEYRDEFRMLNQDDIFSMMDPIWYSLETKTDEQVFELSEKVIKKIEEDKNLFTKLYRHQKTVVDYELKQFLSIDGSTGYFDNVLRLMQKEFFNPYYNRPDVRMLPFHHEIHSIDGYKMKLYKIIMVYICSILNVDPNSLNVYDFVPVEFLDQQTLDTFEEQIKESPLYASEISEDYNDTANEITRFFLLPHVGYLRRIKSEALEDGNRNFDCRTFATNCVYKNSESVPVLINFKLSDTKKLMPGDVVWLYPNHVAICSETPERRNGLFKGVHCMREQKKDEGIVSSNCYIKGPCYVSRPMEPETLEHDIIYPTSIKVGQVLYNEELNVYITVVSITHINRNLKRIRGAYLDPEIGINFGIFEIKGPVLRAYNKEAS